MIAYREREKREQSRAPRRSKQQTERDQSRHRADRADSREKEKLLDPQ